MLTYINDNHNINNNLNEKYRIEVSKEVMSNITGHMEACYPLEGCGVLLGDLAANRQGTAWRITEFLPSVNVSASPERAFTLDPNVWVPACLSQRVIGIVHSHPLSGPEPSTEDLIQLQSFGQIIKAYMIVSTAGREFKVQEKNPPIHSLYGVELGENKRYQWIDLFEVE